VGVNKLARLFRAHLVDLAVKPALLAMPPTNTYRSLGDTGGAADGFRRRRSSAAPSSTSAASGPLAGTPFRADGDRRVRSPIGP